jgi:hypothetical protein
MRVKSHNFVALFLAMIVGLQALVPASAMAVVSVRCAGAATTAPPCATAVMPADQPESVTHSVATMACCRAMGRHCAMMMMPAAASTPSAVTTFGAPKCRVTVTSIGLDRVAVSFVRNQPLGQTPVALATPVSLFVAQLALRITTALSTTSLVLPQPDLTGSQGLRAPPAANH